MKVCVGAMSRMLALFGSISEPNNGRIWLSLSEGYDLFASFFELDATLEDGKIIKRGFVDVVNRFGGNCFACHVQARPEWDMVCETEHGCAPIPLTHAMKLAVQKSDPRSVPPSKLSDGDVAALGELSLPC